MKPFTISILLQKKHHPKKNPVIATEHIHIAT